MIEDELDPLRITAEIKRLFADRPDATLQAVGIMVWMNDGGGLYFRSCASFGLISVDHMHQGMKIAEENFKDVMKEAGLPLTFRKSWIRRWLDFCRWIIILD